MAVRALVRGRTGLASSGLCLAEMACIFQRHVREAGLTRRQASALRLRLAGYHYLVIDTPPVLDSADVNMVVDAADAVLLLVNARLGRDAAMRYWDAMAGYRSLARAREHRNPTPCRPSPSVRRAVTQHGTQKKSTEPSSR